MKFILYVIKRCTLTLAITIGMGCFCGVVNGQFTSTTNDGITWDYGAPSGSTSIDTFIINGGTVTFGTPVNMAKLVVAAGATCNINVSITINNLLKVDGICNQNINLINSLKDITVSSTGTFTNYGHWLFLTSNPTITINNKFNNLSPGFIITNNVTINPKGNFVNPSGSTVMINNTFKIGGTFSKATTLTSYLAYDANSGSTKKIEIFDTIVNISDIVYNQNNQWVDSLIVRDNASLTIDNSFNCNRLSLNNGSVVVNKPLTVDTIKTDGTNSLSGTKTISGLKNITAKTGSTYLGIPLNINSIKIMSGSVVLSAKLRIASVADIASGAGLTSNGYLTMLDQSNLYFVSTGQITGNIQWQRNYGSNGWIYYGVPFPLLTRDSIKNGATIYMNEYVESNSASRWVTVPKLEQLKVGTGYIVAMGTALNDTLLCNGNPQLSDVTVSGLTYTTNNGSWCDTQRGYNLVANPFTAPISISGFFADNPALNAIYYWANTGGNNGVFVMRTAGAIVPDPASITNFQNPWKISSTNYLAPNQAFFVKTDSVTKTASFKANKITRDLNNNFLKASTNNILRLIAKNASGTQNDIIFQFNEAATKKYNAAFDFYKMISNTYPLELYSLIDSDKFAIRTLNSDTTEKHIPIGLIVQKNEKHSLQINNFDAISQDMNVFMHDKSTNRFVNLRDSAFTINLTAGSYNNRFELVLKSSESGSNQTENPEIIMPKNILVNSVQNQIFLNFLEEQQNISVQVCDISGRILYNNTFASALGNISIGSYAIHNLYIIKVSGNYILNVNKILLK